EIEIGVDCFFELGERRLQLVMQQGGGVRLRLDVGAQSDYFATGCHVGSERRFESLLQFLFPRCDHRRSVLLQQFRELGGLILNLGEGLSRFCIVTLKNELLYRGMNGERYRIQAAKKVQAGNGIAAEGCCLSRDRAELGIRESGEPDHDEHHRRKTERNSLSDGSFVHDCFPSGCVLSNFCGGKVIHALAAGSRRTHSLPGSESRRVSGTSNSARVAGRPSFSWESSPCKPGGFSPAFLADDF